MSRPKQEKSIGTEIDKVKKESELKKYLDAIDYRIIKGKKFQELLKEAKQYEKNLPDELAKEIIGIIKKVVISNKKKGEKYGGTF